jgi:FkbM family methyltransferase
MADRPDFYSQNFEDVMLARCFSDRSEGFYIDVGAHLEETDSVTKHFYEAGWSGINIEPVTEFANTFMSRKRDITICCAAGAQESTEIMSVSLYTGMSTLDSTNAAKADAMGHIQETREIVIRRLDDILLELGHETLRFEFLKIDVEGFELSVLEGINLNRYRPEVILCEVTQPNTSKKSNIYSRICESIENFNYHPVYFDGLNQWWCSNEKEKQLKQHFNLPPGIFDSPTLTPYNSYSALRQLVKGAEQAKEVQRLLEIMNINLDLAIDSHANTEEQASLRSIQNMLIEAITRLGGATASHAEIEKEIYIRSIQNLLREATLNLKEAIDERDSKANELDHIKSGWAWKGHRMMRRVAMLANRKEPSGSTFS